MTLKKATNIAFICIIVEVLWMITSWTVDTFELINYTNNKWFFKIWIIPALINSAGLLTFFVTLLKKQKGESNV